MLGLTGVLIALIVLTIVLAAMTSWGIIKLLHADHAKPALAIEPIYERIMKTGTIRCGYINWWPAELRDPNTGQMKGYVVDYFNEMAKALDPLSPTMPGSGSHASAITRFP